MQGGHTNQKNENKNIALQSCNAPKEAKIPSKLSHYRQDKKKKKIN